MGPLVNGANAGQGAYEAYCRYSGGVSLVTGDTLPDWRDLSEQIRDAWHFAVTEMLQQIMPDSTEGREYIMSDMSTGRAAFLAYVGSAGPGLPPLWSELGDARRIAWEEAAAAVSAREADHRTNLVKMMGNMTNDLNAADARAKRAEERMASLERDVADLTEDRRALTVVAQYASLAMEEWNSLVLEENGANNPDLGWRNTIGAMHRLNSALRTAEATLTNAPPEMDR